MVVAVIACAASSTSATLSCAWSGSIRARARSTAPTPVAAANSSPPTSPLLVVCAPLPPVDFFLLDRYLCAAHCAGLQPRCSEQSRAGIRPAAEQELRASAAAGIAACASRRSVARACRARAMLQAHSAILVGQSGVGKSSLLRALVPDAAAPIGALIRDDEGRHTTTGTQLYPLPGGGELLDSPGVRDFAPAVDRLEVAALGFPEIEALAPRCRFADCRHLQEPDCAVERRRVAMAARSARALRELSTPASAVRAPQRAALGR